MQRRLFLAVPLPDTASHKINNCLEPWKVKGVRIIPVENWHVTVLFLGDVHEARIPFLTEKVGQIYKETEKFPLKGGLLHFGPLKGRPTMIWALCDKSKVFEDLSRTVFKSVQFMLKPSVREENHREIIPHITLARFKYKPHVLKAQKPLSCPFEIKVRELVLYESTLLPQGPTYARLHVFRLKT